MEKHSIFGNARYRVAIRLDPGTLARYDDYRDTLLTTIGIHTGDKAAFMSVQWVHTPQPPQFATDDDAWMADYYKKKFNIDGHDYIVSELGFLFRNLDDPDDLFYLLDRDLPELAAHGHVTDENGAPIDMQEATGIAMRLYADMASELTAQPWCVCPSSRARTRFLPTLHKGA